MVRVYHKLIPNWAKGKKIELNKISLIELAYEQLYMLDVSIRYDVGLTKYKYYNSIYTAFFIANYFFFIYLSVMRYPYDKPHIRKERNTHKELHTARKRKKQDKKKYAIWMDIYRIKMFMKAFESLIVDEIITEIAYLPFGNWSVW